MSKKSIIWDFLNSAFSETLNAGGPTGTPKKMKVFATMLNSLPPTRPFAYVKKGTQPGLRGPNPGREGTVPELGMYSPSWVVQPGLATGTYENKLTNS